MGMGAVSMDEKSLTTFPRALLIARRAELCRVDHVRNTQGFYLWQVRIRKSSFACFWSSASKHGIIHIREACWVYTM